MTQVVLPLVSVHGFALLSDGDRLLNPSLISITLFANDPSLLPIDDMIVFYYMVSNGRFVNNRSVINIRDGLRRRSPLESGAKP